MAKNMILLTVFLIFGMVFCEIVLRVYYNDDYGVPTDRNWQFKKVWDEKYGNLNDFGYRDHDFEVKKPSNVFRILAIGDSLTWGEGIRNIDDIYPEIFERKLTVECKDRGYEVVNVSRKGWDVKDYLAALKDPGITYKPDILMLGFYINDIELHKQDRPKTPYISENVHFYLGRVSYLYWYTYRMIRPFLLDDREYLNYYLSYSAEESDHWKQFALSWKEILAVAKEHHIQPVVLILPITGWLGEKNPFIPVYTRVEELSKSNGAKTLNLLPFVNNYSSGELAVGITDGHPNLLAHKIYGEAIFKFMIRENLVPCQKESVPN